MLQDCYDNNCIYLFGDRLDTISVSTRNICCIHCDRNHFSGWVANTMYISDESQQIAEKKTRNHVNVVPCCSYLWGNVVVFLVNKKICLTCKEQFHNITVRTVLFMFYLKSFITFKIFHRSNWFCFDLPIVRWYFLLV